MSEIIGLDALQKDLDSLPQAFSIIHARYSRALAGGWKLMILEVDAIDSHDYLLSVAAHVVGGASAKEFLIDTSNNPGVNYSDIVEQGRRPGGKPPNENHPGYAGRFPAGRSLDAQDSVDLLETFTTETLDQFLHS